MKTLLVLMLLFLVLSCQPQKAGEVSVTTAGIKAPFEMTLNGLSVKNGESYDLGEHVITDGPILFAIEFKNNTAFPLTELNVEVIPGVNKGVVTLFKASEDGSLSFPGDGGTCGRTLESGESCLVHLEYAPRVSGLYKEDIRVSFKNRVDPEVHSFSYQYLSGTPASLTFEDDISQFTFGNLVGFLKVPIVERSEDTVYEKEVEITNTGELSARDIRVRLNQNCLSAVTNNCPNGMNTAFEMTHNCPTKLPAGEKCRAKVSFSPRNKDNSDGTPPAPAIRELSYTGNLRLNYIKDPKNNRLDLNGYFKSTSTRVEGKFTTTTTNVVFETMLVSGNRDQRTFKINNTGWREGIMKELLVRDPAGSAVIARCRSGQAPKLSCYSNNGTLLTLAEFPFVFKDTDGCINSQREIAVGNGCFFDLIFQPSTSFKTPKLSEFMDMPVEVYFDSRWKSNETLLTLPLTGIRAQSLPEAQLELVEVRLGSTVLSGSTSVASDGTKLYLRDMGRKTLLSPISKYKRELLTITIKNNGGAKAENVVIKDGRGKTIPMSGNTFLGTRSPYYFISAGAPPACQEIATGASCTFTMQFAPLARDTNDEENENMFDSTLSSTPTKLFRISYKGGALYSDLNLDTDVAEDITPPTEIHVTATLVRKGLLLPLGDDDLNLKQLQTMRFGDKARFFLFVTNVGSGPVTDMRTINTPNPLIPANGFQVVSATPYLADFGAHSDCQDHLNQATPVPLQKDKTCVLAVEYDTPNSLRAFNEVPAPDNSIDYRAREYARIWSHSLAPEDLESWRNLGSDAFFPRYAIRLRYFDGDTTVPVVQRSSNFSATLGEQFDLPEFVTSVQLQQPSKISLGAISPWYSATVYRPPYTIPDQAATTILDPISVPAKWFFGETINPYENPNDTDPGNGVLLLSKFSRNILPQELPTEFASASNGFDYIYYVGSFPQQASTYTFPVSLKNYGSDGSLSQPNVTGQVGNLSLSFSGTFPRLATGTVLIPGVLTLNTSTPGWHSVELEYTYTTGQSSDRLIFNQKDPVEDKFLPSPSNLDLSPIYHTRKIIFYAHVQSSPANLDVDLGYYNVTPGLNPTDEPSVTAPGSLSTIPSSVWTHFAANTINGSGIVLEAQRLPVSTSPSDLYAQALVRVKNPTAAPIQFAYYYRSTAGDTATLTPLPSSFTRQTTSTCPTPGTSLILNAGASCDLILRYQPRSGTDTNSRNFNLSLVYALENGSSRRIIKNYPIQLNPIQPANIALSFFGGTACTIKPSIVYGTKSRSSCILTGKNSADPNDSSPVQLNAIPRILSFNQSSGSYRRLQVTNTTTTKASLLATYHDMLGIPYGSSNVPSTYTTTNISIGGVSTSVPFAKIAEKLYPDGSPRWRLDASKGCLFGDDETNSSIPWDQKGFNKDTVTPCYLQTYYYINFRYLNLAINTNDANQMLDNAVRLPYYNVRRSSWNLVGAGFHLEGTFAPSPAVRLDSSRTWSSVWALDANGLSGTTGSLGFTFPAAIPQVPSVGSLVGYRILIAESNSTLNAASYYTHSSYVDIWDTTLTTQTLNRGLTATSGLTRGKIYYFRLLAIRYDARRNGTEQAGRDLASGYYLSPITGMDGNNNLRVLIPPTGFEYIHGSTTNLPTFSNGAFIVERQLTGANPLQFSQASGLCTSRFVQLLEGTSARNRTLTLINKTAWDLLKNNTYAHTYSNHLKVLHWSSDAAVNVTTAFSGVSGFDATQVTQTFPTPRRFYLRNSSQFNANVNTMLGGVLGNDLAEDYWSHVMPSVPARSRCMNNLNGL